MLIEETSKDLVDPVFEINPQQPTGKCAVLLSQKDRCLVPLIGAAGWLSDEYVVGKADLFKNATLLFSEVYFFFAKAELLHKTYESCSQNGVKTCLTLSSQNAVPPFSYIRSPICWITLRKYGPTWTWSSEMKKNSNNLVPI
jgi:adenosine kinase